MRFGYPGSRRSTLDDRHVLQWALNGYLLALSSLILLGRQTAPYRHPD
jgi:hypothetical protein